MYRSHLLKHSFSRWLLPPNQVCIFWKCSRPSENSRKIWQQHLPQDYVELQSTATIFHLVYVTQNELSVVVSNQLKLEWPLESWTVNQAFVWAAEIPTDFILRICHWVLTLSAEAFTHKLFLHRAGIKNLVVWNEAQLHVLAASGAFLYCVLFVYSCCQ